MNFRQIVRLSYVMLIPISLVSISCSDDDDKKEKTRAELLADKKWVISNVVIESGKDSYDITPAWLMDCEEDNAITFETGGIFKADMGDNLCEEGETDVTGTWALKENDSVIEITVDGDPDTDPIIELNATTLKIEKGPITYDLNQDMIDDTEGTLYYILKPL